MPQRPIGVAVLAIASEAGTLVGSCAGRRWRSSILEHMKARLVSFGLVELDGRTYDYDVLVERGRVSRRRKKASKPQRDRYGHTPLTTAEPLPWRCRQLIVGTGAEGRLPVAPEVIEEARRRGVELLMLPTAEACARLSTADVNETAAVLHVTC